MKLLILAPFVCKHSVGEGANAYRWISRLAARHDVTLLTYNLRADEPASIQRLGARVVEWDDLPGAGRFPRLNSELTPGYVPFFWRCRQWMRAHLERERFDLVHQLAPRALRYPCPAVGLSVPYVVGPLGGSLEAPAPLADSVEGEPLYHRLRRLDRWRFRRDPLLRATYSGARALIAVAPYVRELLRDIALPPVRIASEEGVERVALGPRPSRSGPPRLLYVGAVTRTKGVRDAIRALGHVTAPGATLDVVGSGDDLEACEETAAALGLEERVHFHGHLPPDTVRAYYRRADLFVFPGFREASGKALLEAMSHGLPVIATDHGGPAAVVDETCGRLVEPAPPDEFARRIAAEIDDVLSVPGELARLATGARERVEEHTWDKKVDWLCELYREVC